MKKQALDLNAALDRQVRGHSLDQQFYTDQSIFDAELSAFLQRQWVNAGHVSRIPQKGDYFLFNYAGYQLIITRTGNGPKDIAALGNVCRHRGARVCEAQSGNANVFTCRYHGWSYKLDGSLANWRHMPEDLQKKDFGLANYGVHIFLGAIFVSLDPEHAPNFDQMVADTLPYWQRYDLANTVVACRQVYNIEANWKLAIENNLECYHCMPSHPEYTKMHAFVRADEKVSDTVVEGFSSYKQKWGQKMQARGLPLGFSDFKDTGGQLCRAGTWPLKEGVATGSRDGRPVGPLLGSIADYDESVTSGAFGFLCYVAAYCDYSLFVSYLPQSARHTRVELTWLVRAGAVPNKDYDPEALAWLWEVTTLQDKDIIELNAKGVGAKGYLPGPYSNLEWAASDFIERYKALMRAQA